MATAPVLMAVDFVWAPIWNQLVLAACLAVFVSRLVTVYQSCKLSHAGEEVSKCLVLFSNLSKVLPPSILKYEKSYVVNL